MHASCSSSVNQAEIAAFCAALCSFVSSFQQHILHDVDCHYLRAVASAHLLLHLPACSTELTRDY
jgi:hypothetical protein